MPVELGRWVAGRPSCQPSLLAGRAWPGPVFIIGIERQRANGLGVNQIVLKKRGDRHYVNEFLEEFTLYVNFPGSYVICVLPYNTKGHYQ